MGQHQAGMAQTNLAPIKRLKVMEENPNPNVRVITKILDAEIPSGRLEWKSKRLPPKALRRSRPKVQGMVHLPQPKQYHHAVTEVYKRYVVVSDECFCIPELRESLTSTEGRWPISNVVDCHPIKNGKNCSKKASPEYLSMKLTGISGSQLFIAQLKHTYMAMMSKSQKGWHPLEDTSICGVSIKVISNCCVPPLLVTGP